MAQGGLWESGGGGVGGSGGGCESGVAADVRGRDAGGGVGVEQWRVDDIEPAVPVAGDLRNGYGSVAGDGLAFYDSIYTERFMGLPDGNPAGYQAASLLPLAGRLRGNLLLMHGEGDDNVHFQNSEMLINALVAADKPFRLMAYPNRSHCILRGEWHDAACVWAAD